MPSESFSNRYESAPQQSQRKKSKKDLERLKRESARYASKARKEAHEERRRMRKLLWTRVIILGLLLAIGAGLTIFYLVH